MKLLNSNTHLIELYQNEPKGEVIKTIIRVYKCYDIELDTAYP